LDRVAEGTNFGDGGAMTHSGLLASGVGTLVAFLALMAMFRLAPSRQTNSKFWRSINSIAPPNFDQRWARYVGACLIVFVVYQATFQLALGR
jgi:hypothetical protein